MFSLFTKHPQSVGETYCQHFCSAMKFACIMVLGFAVCTVHAILPFAFEKTGSRIIQSLHDAMVTHRSRHEQKLDDTTARA